MHLGFKVLDFLLPVLNNLKVCRENLTDAPRARGLLTPSRSSAAAASQSAEPDRTGSETQGEKIEHYLICKLSSSGSCEYYVSKPEEKWFMWMNKSKLETIDRLISRLMNVLMPLRRHLTEKIIKKSIRECTLDEYNRDILI